jgi:hypothetical protein
MVADDLLEPERVRENKITGKLDDLQTRDEQIALNDILYRRGEQITLDDMRQLSRPQIEAKLSADVKKVLGANPQFILENDYGDKHREDALGNVIKFTYVNRRGDEVQTYDKIQRDRGGKVVSFEEFKSGRRFERTEPSDVFEPEPKPIWAAIDRKTGVRSSMVYDFGEVSFDKDGVKANGANPAALGIPRRR